MKQKRIVGAAIGDCVHVAGVVNFLNLAEQLGYETVSLGPAISVDELLDKVATLDPALVAVGYRLYTTAVTGFAPLGGLIAGFAADHIGAMATLRWTGLCCLGGAFLSLVSSQLSIGHRCPTPKRHRVQIEFRQLKTDGLESSFAVKDPT